MGNKIAAVHVHEHHVQVVYDDGFFINVNYDGAAQSLGNVETANHDNVTSELCRLEGESLERFADRARQILDSGCSLSEVETAEEIVRTQVWIVNKRKARFGIG